MRDAETASGEFISEDLRESVCERVCVCVLVREIESTTHVRENSKNDEDSRDIRRWQPIPSSGRLR